MIRSARMFSAIFLLGLFAAAPVVRAATTKTETIEFPTGKGTVKGFLATPEKPGRYPAVIVIHDWWGLNDWVKEQTEKIAEQGYVVLAVDLYDGKVATDPAEANELSRGIGQDRAVVDLIAGAIYLSARKDVDRDRIGSVGWSMGGGYSLQLAMRDPHLRACVVNYGPLPTDPNDLGQITAAVLGNFGADDKGITPADVHAFEKTMKTAGKFVDVRIYEGAGHAFANPANTQSYRPDAAADAWTRTINFLNKALK
jgi:carboxymethylenebutenolidase